jgi:ubiquinone/menaquinone biosynthesis C-methylase UbiE
MVNRLTAIYDTQEGRRLAADQRSFTHTWEQAIEALRRDPAHRALIFDSYLTADLAGNGRRFSASEEFAAILSLLKVYAPGARSVLDIPGGNGIAAYAFAKAGFAVTTVEPDPSGSVGRGAIASVLQDASLKAEIIDACGEHLPFADGSFDIVFIRQGLHHAADLQRMTAECARVLRAGGALLACREHVVDNYGASLEGFLSTQVDHQLYGGEYAYTLADYRASVGKAGLMLEEELEPYDSIINLYPASRETLAAAILSSAPGRLLSRLLPASLVVKIGLWRLKQKKLPGRLYSFLAIKPGTSKATEC